jgi:hypothetical protein
VCVCVCWNVVIPCGQQTFRVCWAVLFVCVRACVCVWRGVGVVEYVLLLCCVEGGEYRSLIGTEGCVNLQEGPHRFAMSVNQTNSAGTLCVRACVGGWGGEREECV